MFQIKVVITPENGVSQVALQTDEKEGPSLEALAFFNQTQRAIQKFKSDVQRVLLAQGGNKND